MLQQSDTDAFKFRQLLGLQEDTTGLLNESLLNALAKLSDVIYRGALSPYLGMARVRLEMETSQFPISGGIWSQDAIDFDDSWPCLE